MIKEHLIIDTACTEPFAGDILMDGRKVAEDLILALQQQLPAQKLIFALGPGSFTGIRAGLSAALALRKVGYTLLGVNRFDVLALAFPKAQELMIPSYGKMAFFRDASGTITHRERKEDLTPWHKVTQAHYSNAAQITPLHDIEPLYFRESYAKLPRQK